MSEYTLQTEIDNQMSSQLNATNFMLSFIENMKCSPLPIITEIRLNLSNSTWEIDTSKVSDNLNVAIKGDDLELSLMKQELQSTAINFTLNGDIPSIATKIEEIGLDKIKKEEETIKVIIDTVWKKTFEETKSEIEANAKKSFEKKSQFIENMNLLNEKLGNNITASVLGIQKNEELFKSFDMGSGMIAISFPISETDKKRINSQRFIKKARKITKELNQEFFAGSAMYINYANLSEDGKTAVQPIYFPKEFIENKNFIEHFGEEIGKIIYNETHNYNFNKYSKISNFFQSLK